MLSIGELVGYVKLNTDEFDKGLDSTGRKLGGAGKRWTGIAKKAGLAVGAAAAGAVAYGMLRALDVGAANDKLSAQLGLTEAESERIGGVAGRLYADAYGESIDHVNGAVSAVMSSIDGMAKASDKRLQDVTARALDFAEAFEVDVARAAQVAGQWVNRGLADDAEAAFDQMTAASQKVPANIREDLLDAADEYGPFFEQIGMDGEQAFGLLVKSSEKGMYGIDKAGDAVKEFAALVSTDMERTKPVIRDLGLNYENTADAMLAGGDKAADATGKIVDALLDVESDSERARKAVELFGTPLEDMGTKDIPKFLRSLQDATGAMGDTAGASEKLGDTLHDNAARKVESFKRSAQTKLVGFLGNQVIPVLEDAADTVNKYLGPAFEDAAAWIEANVVPALRDMHDWFTRSGGGIDQMKAALQDAQPFIHFVREALKKVIPFVLKLARNYLPVLAEQWRQLGAVLGFIGKVAIGLWNHFFQPMIKFIIDGIGRLMQMWGRMLQTLGKVPGFEWAAEAGDKLVAAGNKARGFAKKVRDIPDRKNVKVTLGLPNLRKVSDELDWVARPRQARITLTETYAKAGRETYGGVQKRAGGGTVAGGYPVELAERGAELFIPSTDGRIVPHHLLDKALLGQGQQQSSQETVVRERVIVERDAPLIGQVVQQPGEDTDELAEGLWFKSHSRG